MGERPRRYCRRPLSEIESERAKVRAKLSRVENGNAIMEKHRQMFRALESPFAPYVFVDTTIIEAITKWYVEAQIIALCRQTDLDKKTTSLKRAWYGSVKHRAE